VRVALYHNLPPGGAMRTVREFLAHRRGHLDCDVFTLDFGEDDPFVSIDGDYSKRDLSGLAPEFRQPVRQANWHRGSYRLKSLDQLARVRAAERSLARLIDNGGYDVAYVHPCWFGQSPSILRDLAVPTVYFMQERRRASFEPGYATKVSPKRLPVWLVAGFTEKVLRRRDVVAAHRADRVLANSHYSAGTIVEAYGIDPVVTHLGVDTSTFRPLGGTTAPAHVLSVGGLEAFKGHHLVLEALAELPRDRRPELSLVYERCDDAYRAELLANAEARGVVVREYPAISDDGLAELYSTATATVLAARLEPLGLVVLESIACGTPVVAADEGGYRDTVDDGHNGFLVPRTPSGLASGISRVLAGELDQPPGDLRGSILPYWSLEESVARQEAQLRAVMPAGDGR
jgi:glycosyltransferase involved in cell wall biosynthesis